VNTPPTVPARNPAELWPIRSHPALILIVITLAILAVLAAWFNGLPVALRLALTLLAVSYTLLALKAVLRPRLHSIGLQEPGLRVMNAAGQAMDLTVTGRVFVSPLFISLSGHCPGQSRPLVLGLFRGQLEDHAYRRLAAWLRTRHGQ